MAWCRLLGGTVHHDHDLVTLDSSDPRPRRHHLAELLHSPTQEFRGGRVPEGLPTFTDPAERHHHYEERLLRRGSDGPGQTETVRQAGFRVDETAAARGARHQQDGERRRSHGHHGDGGQDRAIGEPMCGRQRQPQRHRGQPDLPHHDTDGEEQADEDRTRDEEESEDGSRLTGPIDDHQDGHGGCPVGAEQSTRVGRDVVPGEQNGPDGERAGSDRRRGHHPAPRGCPQATDHSEGQSTESEIDSKYGQRAQQLERGTQSQPDPDTGERPTRRFTGDTSPVSGGPALGGGSRLVPSPPWRGLIEIDAHC